MDILSQNPKMYLVGMSFCCELMMVGVIEWVAGRTRNMLSIVKIIHQYIKTFLPCLMP